jgi:hypothetical protein
MAITAAPITPATPMLATLTEAAPVEELPLAPVVVAAPDVGLADVALFNMSDVGY